MVTRKKAIIKEKPRFANGYPRITVKGFVSHPTDQTQNVPFEKDCVVDTGYSEELMVSSDLLASLSARGIQTFEANFETVGSEHRTARGCYAMITQIGKYVFSKPIDISLWLYGNDKHGLLGRGVLNQWIAEFDGPRTLLTISSRG